MDGGRWITQAAAAAVESYKKWKRCRIFHSGIIFSSSAYVHSSNVLATRPKVNLVCVCLCQGFQSWPAVLTDREHHEGKKQRAQGTTGNIIRTLNTLPKFIIYGIRK